MTIFELRLKCIKTVILVLLVIGVCSVSSCATRQDVIYLHQQIKNLKNSMDQLALEQNKEINNTLTPLKEFQSSIAIRIDSMDVDIRSLRGDMELLNHRTDELSKSLKSFKIKQLKQTQEINPADTTGLTPDNTTKSPGLNMKKINPQDEYTEAKELYDKGIYEASRKAFANFITRYPDNKLTGNSQFWLAENYFKEGNYKKSILEHQKFIDNFKQHPKIPSAYLKEGLAYYKLGDSFAGKLILEKLIKLFPKTKQAKAAKNKLNNLKK